MGDYAVTRSEVCWDEKLLTRLNEMDNAETVLASRKGGPQGRDVGLEPAGGCMS